MSKDTYMVPGEIALAVSTGRTMFITQLINNVTKGHPLSEEHQVELLRMLKDMIEDKYRQDGHFAEMKKLVRLFKDYASGVEKKADELRDLVKKAEDAKGTEEDD